MANTSLAEKEYRIITIAPTDRPEEAKLRVAAYCRVSSDSDDQLNSFAAQNQYYTKLIAANDKWKLVDIYADEGITGTSTEKREDFKRMLNDCRRGLIDRVLVKSISRFARNTRDCLEAIRELKSIGVSVYFEEQKIDTGNASSELLTSVFASIAQSESESISQNMRWSYRRRMESGSFNTCRAPYGFRLVDGSLIIEPNEAETIKSIFAEYLNGKSAADIVRRLKDEDSTGKAWNVASVKYVLRNERYAGNALLQKRYSTGEFPQKMKYNRGERDMFFVEGANEGIISPEVFNRARSLRTEKDRKIAHTPNPQPLSKITFCCFCGKIMRSKPIRGKRYMVCREHEDDRNKCPLPPVPDDEIISAFLRLYYKLKHHPEILREYLDNLYAIRNRKTLWSADVVELNKRISELSSQNHLLNHCREQGLIDSDIYISQANELAEALRAAKLQKERILNAESDDTIPRTEALLESIEAGPEMLEEFDAELFSELVDRITVVSNTEVRFRLKNGLELMEHIERTMR